MTTLKQRKLIVARAVRMIREGDTVAKAAEKLGVKRPTLAVWMCQQNIRVRDKNIDRNIDIIDSYKNNIPVPQIAIKHNLSEAQIYFILKNEGLGPMIKDGFEMTFTEIGKELDLSESVVRKDYRSAMKKLRVLVVEFDISIIDIIRENDGWMRI